MSTLKNSTVAEQCTRALPSPLLLRSLPFSLAVLSLTSSSLLRSLPLISSGTSWLLCLYADDIQEGIIQFNVHLGGL